jgi:hypothetical protein
MMPGDDDAGSRRCRVTTMPGGDDDATMMPDGDDDAG